MQICSIAQKGIVVGLGLSQSSTGISLHATSISKQIDLQHTFVELKRRDTFRFIFVAQKLSSKAL